MANKHDGLNSLFTDIANAIRTKTKKTDAIVADKFPDEIKSITLGSGDATESDVKEGKTFSNDSGVHTGTFAAQTKTITSNGTYTPDSGKYLSSVTVNVHIDIGGTSVSSTTGGSSCSLTYNSKCVFICSAGGSWIHGRSAPGAYVSCSCSGTNVVRLYSETHTMEHDGNYDEGGDVKYNNYGSNGITAFYCPSGGTASVNIYNSGSTRCWIVRVS